MLGVGLRLGETINNNFLSTFSPMDFHARSGSGIVDSPNTDLNSAWMAMGLRSVFDESTIKY